MNCRRTRSLLSAYIDSELTGQEMLLIRDHLSCCSSCAEERESLLQIKRLLSALPEHAPRPSLVFELEESLGKHPAELSMRRFFRSLIPQSDSPSTAISSMSIYGRRFAMAGVLSLMSVWFTVAPSVSESPSTQVASAGHGRHMVVAKLRRFVNRYDEAVFGRAFGQPSIAQFGQDPQVQDANLSLVVSPQDQLRSMPIMGTSPFGQNVYLGNYSSPQPTSLGSFVYTGYSVASH